MSAEKQSMYVGGSKEFNTINGSGMRLDLDITMLLEYIKGEAKDKVRQWKDKNGKIHESIYIDQLPLLSGNRTKYKTHFAKIDDWEKPTNGNPQQPVKVNQDDVPF